MENGVTTPAADDLVTVLMKGDLATLTPAQEVSYYKSVCDSVGLNPLTQPFVYMHFNGKKVLYAGKNCAEQLRQNHRISVEIIKREKIENIYIVTAKASTAIPNRSDESSACLDITGLAGQNLANAMMKCETKAKRRVTLSICGLGMLDETEIEDTPERPAQNWQDKQPAIEVLPLAEKINYWYDIAGVKQEKRQAAIDLLKAAGGTTNDPEIGLEWHCTSEVAALKKYRIKERA